MVSVASDPAMTSRTGVLARTRVHDPAGPGRVPEQCADLAVHPARGLGPARHHLVRRTEHPAREGQGVRPEVEQRPAREVVPLDPVVRVEPGAVAPEDRADLAEHVGVQHLPDHVELRREQRPQRLGAEEPTRGREVGELLRLGRVQGDRLLDEDVLARLQREARVRAVPVVRRGDVDDVDLGVGDQVLVRPVGVPDPEPPGEGLRGAERPAADGDDLLGGQPLQRGDEPFRDPARADHAPAQSGRVPWVRDPRGGEDVGPGHAPAPTRGTSTRTRLPSACIEPMTASATALATRPSYAVASGPRSPPPRASTQVCSSRR